MYILVEQKLVKVERCRDCPYFRNTMDGATCNHPWMIWAMEENKDPYFNLIDVNTTPISPDCPEIQG